MPMPQADIDILTPDLLDAGKRAHEAIMMHVMFADWDDIKNSWLAIKLEDGRCDGVLYDTAEDAIKHQPFENQVWYVCFRGLGPAGSKPMECALMIHHFRKARDAGFRFVDPDKRYRAPMMTTRQFEYQSSLVKSSIETKVDQYLKSIGRM